LVEVRLRVAKCVTREHEVGRSDGNGGDSGAFQRGGEEARAQALAERCKSIEKLGRCDDRFSCGNRMKQVATERIEFARDAIVRGGFEPEFTQHIVMRAKNEFGFNPRSIILPVGEKLRDAKQLVGYAFHRGDNHDNVGILRYWLHEFGGMQHARGAEQRSPAKLERDNFSATTERSASFMSRKCRDKAER
jgi:hypothetical protein